MTLEPKSFLLGAILGVVMSALGSCAIGPMVFREQPDDAVLLAGLSHCQAKYPIYVSRIGAIVRIACNGHHEGRQ